MSTQLATGIALGVMMLANAVVGLSLLLGACLMVFPLDGQQLTGNLVPSLLTMAVSIVTGVSMYLAFLPPRSYLAGVQRWAT